MNSSLKMKSVMDKTRLAEKRRDKLKKDIKLNDKNHRKQNKKKKK